MALFNSSSRSGNLTFAAIRHTIATREREKGAAERFRELLRHSWAAPTLTLSIPEIAESVQLAINPTLVALRKRSQNQYMPARLFENLLSNGEKELRKFSILMVDLVGIEPTTSSMPFPGIGTYSGAWSDTDE